MLFIDIFGHVKQPSPWRDVNRTLCLFIRKVARQRLSRGRISSSANENSCSIKVQTAASVNVDI